MRKGDEWFSGKRGAEGREGGTQGAQGTFGVTGTLTILTAVMILWVYTYVKTYQLLLKCVQFIACQFKKNLLQKISIYHQMELKLKNRD